MRRNFFTLFIWFEYYVVFVYVCVRRVFVGLLSLSFRQKRSSCCCRRGELRRRSESGRLRTCGDWSSSSWDRSPPRRPSPRSGRWPRHGGCSKPGKKQYIFSRCFINWLNENTTNLRALLVSGRGDSPLFGEKNILCAIFSY